MHEGAAKSSEKRSGRLATATANKQLQKATLCIKKFLVNRCTQRSVSSLLSGSPVETPNGLAGRTLLYAELRNLSLENTSAVSLSVACAIEKVKNECAALAASRRLPAPVPYYVCKREKSN